MFLLNDRMQELSQEFMDNVKLSEGIMEGDIAEKVDRLEHEVDEVTKAIKSIVGTLDYAVDVRADSFNYLEGVGDLDEETQAVVTHIIEEIRQEIYAEIKDMLCPGSRIED